MASPSTPYPLASGVPSTEAAALCPLPFSAAYRCPSRCLLPLFFVRACAVCCRCAAAAVLMGCLCCALPCLRALLLLPACLLASALCPLVVHRAACRSSILGHPRELFFSRTCVLYASCAYGMTIAKAIDTIDLSGYNTLP